MTDFQNIQITTMHIKVLGTGCSKCKKLEKAVRKTVEEMKISASIEKVEDIQEIMALGVMSTPGLVINDKVVSYGKIPSNKELQELINQHK